MMRVQWWFHLALTGLLIWPERVAAHDVTADMPDLTLLEAVALSLVLAGAGIFFVRARGWAGLCASASIFLLGLSFIALELAEAINAARDRTPETESITPANPEGAP